jgi:hypothetical protein
LVTDVKLRKFKKSPSYICLISTSLWLLIEFTEMGYTGEQEDTEFGFEHNESKVLVR